MARLMLKQIKVYQLEPILYDKACYLSEFGDLHFSAEFLRI